MSDDLPEHAYKLWANRSWGWGWKRECFLLSTSLSCSRSLSAQPISVQRAQSRKPPTNLCATCEFLKKFVNQKILLFWLYNKQTIGVFSLCDLRFVRCSRDLEVLRDHRLFFILITHKSTRPANPITWLFGCHKNHFSEIMGFIQLFRTTYLIKAQT